MKAISISNGIVIALLILAAFTSASFAEGIVMVKRSNSAPEYWTPIAYKSLEKFTFSLVVHSPTGEKITVPNPEFGELIEFPDFAQEAIITVEDTTALQSKRAKLVEAATRYTKAAALIKPVVTAIDAALENLVMGKVLVGGVWLSKSEYNQKLSDASGMKGSSIASVPFKGSFLKKVRVSAVRGDKISVVHDGGIATIPLSEIPADVLTQLKATSPELFNQAVTVTSTPASASSPTVAGAHWSAPMPPSEIITELRVPSGSIRGDDVYRQVRILAVEPDGLKINHAAGISKIGYEMLPVDLRTKYKFDPAAAAEYRSKTEAQQKEATKWVAEQRGLDAKKREEAQVTEAKQMRASAGGGGNTAFNEVAKGFNATPVASALLMIGEAKLEPGQIYSFSAFVKALNDDAVLGSIDTEQVHFGLVPSAKGGFAKIQASVIPGVPKSLRAVGQFRAYISTGRGRLPQFECLYLQVEGKEVYKAEVPESD